MRKRKTAAAKWFSESVLTIDKHFSVYVERGNLASLCWTDLGTPCEFPVKNPKYSVALLTLMYIHHSVPAHPLSSIPSAQVSLHTYLDWSFQSSSVNVRWPLNTSWYPWTWHSAKHWRLREETQAHGETLLSNRKTEITGIISTVLVVVGSYPGKNEMANQPGRLSQLK